MIGQRLGSYEITAKLGEGGMGEVYRATDTKLRREVAIKVLPAAFVQDAERLARFEREAQLLAQLHHPHVASIFGLDESAGVRALVMELVEGPTLAERLSQGALPQGEALLVARQIAEALEAAHEKGIIHRDLKPQNIKLTLDGTVKVLDFGLAKALDPASGSSGSAADAARSPTLMNSPTLTAAGTRLGVILGTAAYMAPEQARGGVVDKRADIWAFGVVLWETLTGKTLFAADTVPDTLARVLTREPDSEALPSATPRAIRDLLRHCLERNPKNRLRDIGDARILLDDVLGGQTDAERPSASAMPGAGARWSFLAPALIAALIAGAGLVALLDRTSWAPQPLPPPTIVPLTYSGFAFSPDVSPDGRTVVFASNRDGPPRIWIKQLASGEEVPLTEGPDVWPVISPDGSSIAFTRFAPDPEVYRVSIVGGSARRLARDGSSPIWSPDGKSIAFVRVRGEQNADSIIVLPSEGGAERELAQAGNRTIVDWAWSPDGRTIAARLTGRQNFAGQQDLVAFDAGNGTERLVHRFPGGSIGGGLTWIGDRTLLTAIGTSQASRGPFSLLAVPLAGGEPRTLLSLNTLPRAISRAGPDRVVMDATEVRQNLRLVDLAGGQAGAWLSRGASVDRQPVFSRRGDEVFFTSDRGGSLDIWSMSVRSASLRRLTHDPADDWDPYASPDGSRLLWTSNRGGNFEIWSAETDGSDARQLSHDGVDAENATMTPDGQWIVYSSANPAKPGVWKIRADGTDARLLTPGAMTIPELSPDGRWVAGVDASTLYQNAPVVQISSVEDGHLVASLTVLQGTVSSGQFGITVGRPRWLPGSRALLFLSALPENRQTFALYTQPIEEGRDTSAQRKLVYRSDPGAEVESFAVSPDGTRLVVSLIDRRGDLAIIEGLAGLDSH